MALESFRRLFGKKNDQDPIVIDGQQFIFKGRGKNLQAFLVDATDIIPVDLVSGEIKLIIRESFYSNDSLSCNDLSALRAAAKQWS